MKVKADLHNHLRTSGRFYQSDFNQAIDIASKKLGENAIIGIVNYSSKRYERFSGLEGYDRLFVGEDRNGIYVPEKKVLAIRLQEVPTKEGDILVLGTSYGKNVRDHRPIKESIQEARDMGGTIILDHPFYFAGVGDYLMKNLDILEEIDAIEVFNRSASFGFPKGPLPNNANKLAKEFYGKVKHTYPHLGALACSDGHSMSEIGKCWTEIEMPSLDHNFGATLKDSIRKTNLNTPMQTQKSFFDTINHIADLILIRKVSPLLGMRNYFFVDEI